MKRYLFILSLILSLCACTTTDIPQPTQESLPTHTLAAVAAVEPTQKPTTVSKPEFPIAFGYTHLMADGNHLLEGRGSLPAGTSIEVGLDGTPVWVVAVPYEDTSLWAIVLEDGRVQAFWVNPREVRDAQITPNQLPPGSPPLLFIEQGIPKLSTIPSAEQSPNTHPVHLPSQGQRAFIQSDGSLVLMDAFDQIAASLAIDALPDARILRADSGRLLVLSGPTTKYDHGVLGDKIEATGITLVATSPDPRVINSIPVPDGQVIEGIAPIWVDLTGDGVREIIVTLSDGINGAQIVVYSESGEQIVEGNAIGLGYRWRHQIAAAPFGPKGEIEIVDVLTPHIGGTVEFFQIDGERLSKVAQVSGYTSHVLGSRNLDMAAAGDFDGDGQLELLLPNQERNQLGAIQRTPEGANVVWSLPIGGIMNTNLGAVTLNNDTIIIGVGRTDNSFKLWLP